MIGFPNPFQDTTAVRFPMASSSAVEMIARKPSGLIVRWPFLRAADVVQLIGLTPARYRGKSPNGHAGKAATLWELHPITDIRFAPKPY